MIASVRWPRGILSMHSVRSAFCRQGARQITSLALVGAITGRAIRDKGRVHESVSRLAPIAKRGRGKRKVSIKAGDSRSHETRAGWTEWRWLQEFRFRPCPGDADC